MTTPTYTSDYNAIRGFRRQFPHLAALSTDMIRCDFVNREAGVFTISLEAVADYEADRMGELNARRYQDVPALRRSLSPKGATSRVRAFFSTLAEGTSRKDAVSAAVEQLWPPHVARDLAITPGPVADVKLRLWTPKVARRMFMERFWELTDAA